MSKIKNSKHWINGNEEDGCTLGTLAMWSPMFLEDYPRIAKMKPYHHVFEFDNRRMRWFVNEDESLKVAEELLERVLKNPRYFSQLRRSLVSASNTLCRFAEKILKQDLAKLSNQALITLFKKHKALGSNMMSYGMISTLIEIPHSQFVKYVENLLTKHVEEKKLPRSAPEYFTALSSIPEVSVQRKEAMNLLKLLAILQKSKKSTQLLRTAQKINNYETLKKSQPFGSALQKHVKDFCWAYYGYIGPAFGVERVVKELIQLLDEKVNPAVELKRLKKEQTAIGPAIKKIEKNLQLSTYERDLFQALRDTVFMKLYRKDATTFAFYAMERALREFARRAGISYETAQCVVPGEHERTLKGDQQLRAELKRRIPYSVFVARTAKPYALSGDEARKYIHELYQEEEIGEVSELKGQVACLGEARGVVKIINTPQEMYKMKPGDILVAAATIPDIVPAMKQAAAIVTDMGGITSHAAIVSRELGVPCVIGTKIATRVFKDGDMVEVDARKGIVRKMTN